MRILSRWFAPAVLAAGLGFGAMAPVPAQAQDTLTRVLVDIADVVFRSGNPYYRYGNYDQNDRLIVGRDRYGRPVYYRQVPYGYRNNTRNGPPYGNAYGYYRNGPGSSNNGRRMKCNKHGKCKVEYYDPRYDRHNANDHHDRYSRYDRDDDRYWDGRRWRDRDDD